MNVLFLTLMRIKSFSQTGIYPDLINEFADNGYDIYVVSPCEHRDRNQYELIKEKGTIHLIQALIPDYYGVDHIRKGISSMMIQRCYLKAIGKAIPEVKFDLILYSTPPITFCGVIDKIKKRDNAYAYLLLKDIWPQGPIDVGALSTTGLKGIITSYFKKKETLLYKISDYIGCMSERNCRYLIDYSGVDRNKLEICPNSIKIHEVESIDKKSVRLKLGLPTDKTIFVYGGNLGIAQGIDYIIDCLKENEKLDRSFILIVGAGTEYSKLDVWFQKTNPQNCKLLRALPQDEYKGIMAACDVGLIFLDYRFTIPNFPSRLLSYMEAKLPVLAATDAYTDVGEVITNGDFGCWCESNDNKEFIRIVEYLSKDADLMRLGENAYNYLCNHYDVHFSYETIVSHINSGSLAR